MIAGLKKDSSKGKSQIVKNSVPAIWQRRSALSGKEASPQGGDLYRKGRFCAGAGGRTRTGTPSLAVDFESTTSTNSITPAYCGQPDPKHVFTREGTGNMHIIVHPGQIGKNFFCVPMEIFRNRRGEWGATLQEGCPGKGVI